MMHRQLSPEPARRPERFAGFVLALLVQAGFLALLVISRPTFAPQEKLTKELTLFLPRLPRTAPQPLSLPAPMARAPRNLVAPLPIVPAPPLLNTLRAAPMAPDLSGLGQSMFGCAPEVWSSLTSEQKAKCPRPGEGLTVRNAPDLLNAPRSQSKDEAHWQEQWTEDHWTLGLCPVGESQMACLLAQIHEEHDRAAKPRQDIDDAKAAALREPKPVLPPNIGVRPP